MTEQKEAPGTDAVYLYNEEYTDDILQNHTVYQRIKILQPKGLELATIHLSYTVRADGKGSRLLNFSGRTIHSDGTILPMTEAPAEKTTPHGKQATLVQRTYQLPQPDVGSILEYRYTRRYENHVEAPYWNVQLSRYTRKGHFEWQLVNGTYKSGSKGSLDRPVSTVKWSAKLPSGAEVHQVKSGTGVSAFTLDTRDIPPSPNEQNMPPRTSFAYSVQFFYSSTSTPDAFWKDYGKQWSETLNRFIGPGPGVKAAVAGIVSPADTPEAKLRKLYNFVMQLDNLSVKREQGAASDISQSVPFALSSTDEVLTAKAGTDDALNSLFVAMVRAAGFTAYTMRVANRDSNIFNPLETTFSQLTDDITIVELDGKQVFLDPGTRFCPFGHLSWLHAGASGLRQVRGGVELATAPVEQVAAHQVQRVANLKLEEDGKTTGKVTLTYLGTAAIDLRQLASVKGETALQQHATEMLKQILPAGLAPDNVVVTQLASFEQPLIITAGVSGRIGDLESGKISLPASFFEARADQLFKEESRQTPIQFRSVEFVADAIRISFPTTMVAAPPPAINTQKLDASAVYDLSITPGNHSVTMRRTYELARLAYPVSDYPKLQSFYAKIASNDAQRIILTNSAAAANKQ